ncbi:MAG: hypothetical protein CVV47_10620 [Spirochaetae bacterium HGW-Spirochaetae-3]|jgi:PAS domain S-box-containing protein|nr:MAG: hypothetical protein CVV47_10620 [Spirochaetae bacterium HGW-Spirochaetae-3]
MRDDNGKTILLVEDEAIIALAGKRTLEAYGYAVVSASSGEKAVIAAAGDSRIDLVLMDINLGDGIDGTEAAARILRERELPLVFLSSYTERETVEKTEGITSYGYIVKNSGETVLVAGIRMAFKLFEAKKKIQAQSDDMEAAYEEMQVANDDLLQTIEELNAANAMVDESSRLLSLSEKKYRELVESSHDIIYILSPDGIFTFVSPAWTRVLGHPLSSVIGQPFELFVHPDDVPACRACLSEAIESGRRIEDIEYRARHLDGSWRRHSSSAGPLRDESGSVIGFEGLAVDITERHLALERLRTSEERYLKAQRIGRVGNWEYDLRTDSFWGSDEAKRIYGFDPDEEGFSPDEVESRILERDRVHQALIDLIEHDAVYNLEFEIRPKGQERTRIIWSVAELHRSERGEPTLVTGVVQDITERALAQRNLIASETKYRKLIDVLPLVGARDAPGYTNG